jgi:hypothetical protein
MKISMSFIVCFITILLKSCHVQIFSFALQEVVMWILCHIICVKDKRYALERSRIHQSHFVILGINFSLILKIKDHEQPTLPYCSRIDNLLATRFLCVQRGLFNPYFIDHCCDSDTGACNQRLIGLYIGSHTYG